jgi:ABC-2 type transport system ATP-binding protein
MAENEMLVKVQDLYRYYDRHCAVQDLNFELRKGEILGLLGPNGAGKTSTMQMLSGNLAPSAGQIFIGGIDLLDEPKRAKRALGYLPEQPPLYPDLTVDEYLDYCAKLHRLSGPQQRVARNAAKERCGLKDSGRRLIGNLSKGYQQRVGIAQAIIHSPAVVILDEPTVGLDPIQVREIRSLIGELGREHAVILSTHILPEVQSVCSRVQIIHRGLVLACRAAPDTAVLQAIPGVLAVEPLVEGKLRIRFAPPHDPAEAVAAEAVRRGWGLRELTPEQKSLEQIFVELTTADEALPAEAKT